MGPEHPVARHEPREAPLVAQHVGEQCTIDVHVLAAHPVVGSHHGVGSGIDNCLEMRQINLVQHMLVNRHVDLETLVLHRVQREVLHASHHVRLEATGHGGSHPARQHRILAVALLRAPPRGVAEQVDAHGSGVVRIPRPRLQADRSADALLQRRIPGRGPGHRYREGGRGADHHPPGAIAETDAGDAEPPDRSGNEGPPAQQHRDERQQPPGGVAVEQPEELLIGHLVDQLVCGGVGIELACPDCPDCRAPRAALQRRRAHPHPLIVPLDGVRR